MTAETTMNVAPTNKRAVTRAQGIRRFKWAVLSPFIVLMVFILGPALLLQGYFSFFSFSIFDAGEDTGFGSYFRASEWAGVDLWADALSDSKFGFARAPIRFSPTHFMFNEEIKYKVSPKTLNISS